MSVGVLENGTPVAGAVVEFAGSQGNWHTRMYTAYKGGGCFLDGRKVSVSNEDSVQQSLLVSLQSAETQLDEPCCSPTPVPLLNRCTFLCLL